MPAEPPRPSGTPPAAPPPHRGPALGRCCHLPAPPHRPHRLSLGSPALSELDLIPTTLSPCLYSSLHPISLIPTPPQPFTPPSLLFFIPASLPFLILISPRASIPALSQGHSWTCPSPGTPHSSAPRAQPQCPVQPPPTLPGRGLQSRAREEESAIPTATSPPKQAEEGSCDCDRETEARPSEVHCTQAGTGRGTEHPVPVLPNSAGVRIIPAFAIHLPPYPHCCRTLRATDSQVTPYKQFWACNGKTALGELREKGDMEIPVRAPPVWSSGGQAPNSVLWLSFSTGSHRALTAPVPQERDWKAGGRSPQGPGCPHGAQDILMAPCTQGDT